MRKEMNAHREHSSEAARSARSRASHRQVRARHIRTGALLALAVVLAVITLSSPASALSRRRQRVIQVVLLDHDRHISDRSQERGARALTIQVNRDLRSSWPGPRVVVQAANTGRGARWRLTVAPLSDNTPVSGTHGENSRGVWATVYPSSGVAWTWSASHELLEMLEDPTGHVWTGAAQREICDPVESVGYFIRGVIVSDFVTPAYFWPGSSGPWDYLNWLTGPVLP